jgi:hypothetical protein
VIEEESGKAITAIQQAGFKLGLCISDSLASKILNEFFDFNQDIGKVTVLREQFRSLRPSEFPRKKFNVIAEIKKLP